MAKFFFTQEQNIELLVKEGSPLGGAVVATHVWMKAIYELGHQVALAKNKNDSRPILKDFSWIETIPVYHSEKGIPMIRWLTYRLPQFFRVLKESNSDYMFESIPTWVSFFLGFFCRVLQVKQVIRIANDNMLDERFKLTHSLFDRIFISLAFRNASIILTQNEFQYKTLKRKLPNQKIIKLSNPFILDPQFLKPKNKCEGYIAWVANFRFQKNLKLLYQIAQTLPNESFKIAGLSKKELDSETSEYLEKLKFLPNTQFVGLVSRENIMSFFSEAKFLLNTSRYEGFSNTFLEAMSTGTPILTTEKVNPDGIIDKFDLGVIYKDGIDLKLKLNSLSTKEYFDKSINCIRYLQESHDHLVLGRHLLKLLEIPISKRVI